MSADVRQLIGGAGPDDMRARILSFVDAHPDALSRSCAEGHLTASALVLDAARQRGLLMHHRKVDRWLQTGGHADGDPDLAGVALREASEESGIGGLVLLPGPVDVDVHRFVAPPEPVHLHLDVRWLALAPPDARPVANAESLELRWFTLDELAAFEEPGMRRLAAAARTLSV